MLKNAYFSHLFRHFWPKFFFFKSPASSDFWNHRKLPWCQKSEKTMEPFKQNPSGRTDARTHVRTYVREQIYRTSQIFWVGPKKANQHTIKSIINGGGQINRGSHITSPIVTHCSLSAKSARGCQTRCRQPPQQRWFTLCLLVGGGRWLLKLQKVKPNSNLNSLKFRIRELFRAPLREWLLENQEEWVWKFEKIQLVLFCFQFGSEETGGGFGSCFWSDFLKIGGGFKIWKVNPDSDSWSRKIQWWWWWEHLAQAFAPHSVVFLPSHY